MSKIGTSGINVIVICIMFAMGVGCNSEQRKAERKEKIEADLADSRQQLALVEAEIAKLESQKQTVKEEVARREEMWHKSVLARHPNWTPERQKNRLSMLDYKWHCSNLDEDAKTVRGMISHGCRLQGYNDELVNEDYWDVARAKSYQINEGYEIEETIRKQLEPLNQKREYLLQAEKRLVSQQ